MIPDIMAVTLLLQAASMVPQESWLVGGWGPGRSSCRPASDIRFETDGTYNDLEGEGVWDLAGDRLSLISTSGDDFGHSQVVQLRVRTPVEMELEWPDGTRARFYRCAQGR